MIGLCGMDTRKCEKSREECEHWAKCSLEEIEERNEKGLLQIYKNRIVALEHALCEAEARALHNFQRYDGLLEAFMQQETTWCEGPSWDDLSEEEKEVRTGLARKMLQAEGKL